jgi:hypothetical protein
MSLKTPSKIRELQSKLYRKAKKELPVQSHGTRRLPVSEERPEAGFRHEFPDSFRRRLDIVPGML